MSLAPGQTTVVFVISPRTMAELDTQPEPTSVSGPHPGVPSTPPDDDPLAHLAKMSTTAGVGSQDYVAVNLAAILAALLGLASVLALLNDVWLVIPAAGVVCAIVAWRQIRNSNGTQTGSGVAMIGLALSLLIGGGVMASKSVKALAQRRDEQTLTAAMHALGDDLAAGHYHEAYMRFSERFQQRVSEAAFTETWETTLGKGFGLGRVKTLDWNGRALFEDEPGTGRRFAWAGMIPQFQKPMDPPPRWDVRFSRGPDGRWLIEDLQQVFPVKPTARKK